MLRRSLGRVWPTGASSQLVALLILSVLAMHIVATAAFLIEREHRLPGRDNAARASLMLRMLDTARPDQREALLALAQRTAPELDLRLVADREPTPAVDGDRSEPDLLRLATLAGEGIVVRPGMAGGPEGVHGFVARLGDGEVIAGMLERRPPPPFGPFWITLVFLAISIAMLVWWSTSQVVLPLRVLAQAAERYSPEGVPIAFAESGPREIRATAHALNHMQERIALLVAERTRMLTAVSHDLRTPITRLRLRAEFVPDETERNRTLIDLGQMETLVEEALTYLRTGGEGDQARDVEVASLVHTIANRFADLGAAVVCTGDERLIAHVRPLQVDRAVTNLVENALRHAGSAEMVVRSDGAGQIVIEVRDEGPGIPAERRAEVLEPFVRGDAARSLDPGTGLGLGLTIARALVAANGGRLALLDRQPRGLIARMTFPLASGQHQAA